MLTQPKVMRAVVGSTNPVKVAAARAVVQRLFGGDVVLLVVPGESGVRAQPWGDIETRLGAINRARLALGTVRADLGLGLEGGVLEIEDGQGPPELYTSAWCAVLGADGTLGVAGGANLLLPASVACAVRGGLELGEAMDRLLGPVGRDAGVGESLGAIGVLTKGRLDRQAGFEHVLTLAFARFLNPEAYLNEG